VVGKTGTGKSYFLDPHGDLYHRVLDFCAYLNRLEPERKLAQRVIPFNIAETQKIIGFNPTARNARVLTYQVVALMESIRKCWGQDNFHNTPRLARWLYNTGYALIDSKTTFPHPT
jgi:hypothetical protein